MTGRLPRWAHWPVAAAAILLLFWLAATIGGWAPDVRKLTGSVHGPDVADYRADLTLAVAPLSPTIVQDASNDRNGAARPSPGPTGTGTPPAGSSPSGSGPTPTLSVPTPTLPVPTPTLPVPTPTLPVPTPTLPVPTPTLPVATPTSIPTPTLPLPTLPLP